MIVSLLTVMMAQPPQGFALIVTNNRSLDAARPDLSYADDDGVKYASLFDQIHGREQVYLLTELDAATQALFPEAASRVAPPSSAELDRAVAALMKEKYRTQ